MKGLLHTLKHKDKTIKPKKSKNKYHIDAKSRAYVYFKIGNYWWRLSKTQWANHFQLNRTTFCHRFKENYSQDECLGLVPIPRGNPDYLK